MDTLAQEPFVLCLMRKLSDMKLLEIQFCFFNFLTFIHERNMGTLGLERLLSVKSTRCSSRRPNFNPQHPDGSSCNSSVTPVLGGLAPSHRCTCKQNTNAFKNNFKRKYGHSNIQKFILLKTQRVSLEMF